ncbi:MAG: glycoside hydrolase family 65 protein, partial [Enterococcus sp.]
MKVLEKKAFELTEAELGLQETLFHTANGYLGVRGNFEEGYPAGMQTMRGQYVNGFYDIADMKQAEQLYGFANQKEVMLNVADTQSARIFASGVAVTMFENATDFQRILNMEKGVSERSFTWGSAAGKL